MKTFLVVILLAVSALGQGLVLPPPGDPWWKSATGKAFIRSYQDLKQCDAQTIRSLNPTWKARCVKNKVGKGNHVEFLPYKMPLNTVDCDNFDVTHECTVEPDEVPVGPAKETK